MKSKKRRVQKSNRGSQPISKAIVAKLKQFMEYHPSKRFSRNLRAMLIDFLMFEGAIEVAYLQDLLYDLDGLFELLDAIESDGNLPKSHRPGKPI